MTTLIYPFTTEHFNALPDIDEAHANVTPEVANLITSKIGPIFIKHKVEKTLGLCIPHSHFYLKENEILVNVGPMSVPWTTLTKAPEMQDVQPCAWSFTEAGITPYEFIYDTSNPPPQLEEFQLFLDELSGQLDSLALKGKVGLYTLPKDMDCGDGKFFVEMTEGRANLTFDFDLNPELGPGGLLDVLWAFESAPNMLTSKEAKSDPKPLVMKRCKLKCVSRPDKSHPTKHIQTFKNN